MKIMIVSDTHGYNANLVEALEREGKIDMILHLGDSEGLENSIEKLAGCPAHVVAGNNDFFASIPMEKEIEIEGKKILMTHGHRYGVSMNLELLADEALSRNMNVAMFGHTHKPVVEYRNNLTLVNPGSLSYPRQEGRQPSYIMLDTNNGGEFIYEIKYISRF